MNRFTVDKITITKTDNTLIELDVVEAQELSNILQELIGPPLNANRPKLFIIDPKSRPIFKRNPSSSWRDEGNYGSITAAGKSSELTVKVDCSALTPNT